MTLTHTILTANQEQELITRIQAGDLCAQEELLSFNERLIAKTANRYIESAAPDVELEDLMQEGRRAVLHAAMKWDHAIASARNVRKFSTYASWWIHQYIRRYASRHRSGFSRSAELDDKSYLVNRIRNGLLESLEREPTWTEISEASNVPLRKIKAMLSTPGIVRLDSPRTIVDLEQHAAISDPRVNVEDSAENALVVQACLKKLECKSRRYARVMRMIYGVDGDGKVYTRTEVAARFKTSRQRIQQIIEFSIKYMREQN